MFYANKTMDIDAVAECVAPGQTEMLDMLKEMPNVMSAEEIEERKALLVNATITFGEVIITGDTATCEVIVSGLEGREEPNIRPVTLKNVDGKWYFTELP